MLRQEKSANTILDDASSGICASKKDVIDKLKGLAANVLSDINNLNATDAAKLKAKNDAYQVLSSLTQTLSKRFNSLVDK